MGWWLPKSHWGKFFALQGEVLVSLRVRRAVYSAQEQFCWLKQGPLFNIGYPTVELHGKDRTAFIKISKFQPLAPEPVKPFEHVRPAVIGGIVGGLFVGALLVLFSIFWCARRRPRLSDNGVFVPVRCPSDDLPPIIIPKRSLEVFETAGSASRH